MTNVKYTLTFQHHEAGYCKQCGKYQDEMYLATLSVDGKMKSMAVCLECAKNLKKRVDQHNRQFEHQKPHPNTSVPVLQQSSSKTVNIKLKKKSVRIPIIAAAAIILVSVITISAVFGGRTIQKKGSVKESDSKSGAIAATSSNDGWINENVLCFGAYPQTEIFSLESRKDLDANNNDDRKILQEQFQLRKKLEERAKNWHSYGYISGSVNPYKLESNADIDFNTIEMHPSDYMEYCDVSLDGEIYRGVRFNKYRPCLTFFEADGQAKDPNDISKQDDNYYFILNDENGDYISHIYWFRWEPLRWHVIDRDNGLLLCENIIDAQPFNDIIYFENNMQETDQKERATAYSNAEKTVFANNYAESSIRHWLTQDFYDVAFSSAQKSKILTTTLNNDSSRTSWGESGYEQFDAPPTQDKVFLLSVSDVTPFMKYYSEAEQNNPSCLTLFGTLSPYAKCQGVFGRWSSNEVSPWFMRSAGPASSFVCTFESDCRDNDYFCNVSYVNGVRPAIHLDLNAISLPQLETDENGMISE